ncbi:MAG: hypothetical protein ACIAQZ_13215 [Sedimentisphaeraceae bacterium JB056]
MEEAVTDQAVEYKKARLYPRLPLVGIILALSSIFTMGITLCYSVGIGIACLVKFFCKSQYGHWQRLLYLAGFIAPFLMIGFFLDFAGILGSISLISALVFGAYFISMTFNKDSILSDVLMTVIAVLPILGMLWFLAGTSVLKDSAQLSLLLFSIRSGIVLLPFLTLMIIINRFVTDKLSIQIGRIVIRLVLIAALLMVPGRRSFTDQNMFLKGLEKTVSENIDIEAVENWLKTQPIPQVSEDSEEDAFITVALEQQPDFVKTFSGGKDIDIRYNQEQQRFYVCKGDSIMTVFCFYWKICISSKEIEESVAENGEMVLLTPSSYIWCDYSS